MNSKAKGSGGEREFAALCQQHGIDARRNIQMYSRGSVENPDVEGLEGVHVEVKRVEKLNISKAMQQSIADAAGQAVPIVAHRRNREQWYITMQAADWFRFFKEWNVLNTIEGLKQ